MKKFLILFVPGFSPRSKVVEAADYRKINGQITFFADYQKVYAVNPLFVASIEVSEDD